MAVESSYAIAIATLRDWFKNLAQVYQPLRRKTKTNRDLHDCYYCYEFGLAHCAVCTCCDWSK